MQGLPTNLLTKTAPVAAGKVESNSTVDVNGKVGSVAGKESKESKGGFAEIFSGLLGNTETKVEGKTEGKSENSQGEEGKTPANAAEVKLDALLKTKETEKNQKTEVTTLTAEQAMSPDVLKNINNLINRAPIDDTKVEGQIGEKIAATSTNLDQLLKTLKGDAGEVEIEGEVSPESLKQNQKAKSGSPLDFLLKESKSSDVGSVDSKLLQTNPEMVSKLGLSSEDFLSQKAESKESKEAKLATADKTMNLDGEFDLKAFGQKQMNQSMKAYGQKQNLLNDGVIRNTKDLAFGEKKVKASADELTTPDMKIGADLSHMKEQFIPVGNKQEMSQNVSTQGS